ncbi:SIR2 family protein [Promicromonospora sp. NPDC052451]|uniref:SIR2 family protein n=1 Tax=Promicromonospora sp. NPDC052451 TaxID=3364407 RepID=UPI0037C51DBC
MLLGGVQIPADLLTAQEEGRLVIFTGAGISISPPSGLPSFQGLALQVAHTLQSRLNPTSDEWKSQLDAFMDVVDEGEGVDVHRLVQRIVTAPASLPNANHVALARLATQGATRVVTTNYDLHLEKTLRDRNDGEVKVFRAPALPLGDDFEGLVYLHGSAEGEPRRLVVTDRDFSMAYFHGAWATRFLERMFREYTVLFVGYSHSDVVMKYLGLGLGPKSKRYVLTDKPDDPIWKRLQVTVLDYPSGEHDVLTKCLTEWADLGGMGLLDHRQRIRDLVSSASEPTPDEQSYLQDSIRRPDRVGFFCEYAKHQFWLEWAAQEEPFRRLFDRSNAGDDVTGRLARWFSQDFALVKDEGVSEKAWAAWAEVGGVLGTATWNALAHGLHAFSGTRPEHVLRWVWVLMEQEHVGCWTESLDFALEWKGVWADRDLALALLGHLMAPRLVPGRGWSGGRMEIATRGEQYWLDDAWSKKFVPELGVLAPVVLPVAETALLRHLNLEARVERAAFGFSRRRSAIQAHVQDRHRDPIDAVIDAVRDCAEQLWELEPDSARQAVERWLESGHALMHRLAVHVTAVSPGLDANAKVRFVLDRGLAFDRDVAQEVFHLLETATPGADTKVVDELVQAYAPASDGQDDLYSSFTALEWLERCGVRNDRLGGALTALRDKLGNIQGSPYPGLARWSESGGIQDNPPMSVEEFDKKVQASPADAVAFVLSFEDRTFPSSGGPSREDAITMLRDTVQQRPAAGLELWPHIDEHLQLQTAVVSAWGHAEEADDLTAIMGVLVDADLESLNHAVGQFLMFAHRTENARWELVQATATFVERMWNACATDELYKSAGSRDWLMETINVPAGLLMDFWFEMFRRRWAAAGDNWRGLPLEDRAFLDHALADRTQRGAYALTQIAGRLHFLDAADSDWCRSQLLPLGDWNEAFVAEPYWWGVLSFARWNSGLAAAGLLGGLVETVRHLERFGDDQARHWAGLLASIAVRCETPSPAEWVGGLTAKAKVDARIRWIDAIQEELASLDELGRSAVWGGWLAEYWQHRIHGDPVALLPIESNAFAAIAPFAPAAELAAAVELVVSTPSGFNSHADASRHVPDELIDSQPETVGRYFTHLMQNTIEPFWGAHELEPKLRRLVAKPGDWKPLREAALRLGMNLP